MREFDDVEVCATSGANANERIYRAKTAKNNRRRSENHLGALAYDGLRWTFEFGVAVEICGLDRPEMGDAWYRFRIASFEPGPLRAMGGFEVSADGGLSLIERAEPSSFRVGEVQTVLYRNPS